MRPLLGVVTGRSNGIVRVRTESGLEVELAHDTLAVGDQCHVGYDFSSGCVKSVHTLNHTPNTSGEPEKDEIFYMDPYEYELYDHQDQELSFTGWCG
jgi:hypothetical protein